MTKRGWVIVGVLFVLVSLYLYLSGLNDGSNDSGLNGNAIGPDGIDDSDYSGESPGNPTGGAAIVANVVQIWAAAIQQFEGYFPGSRSYRNNNPGNLTGAGDAGTDPDGFAQFSTFAKGEAALVADLTAKLAKYPGYTILQIMARYNGHGKNTPAYAQAVASALGVTTDTTLGDISGANA